MTDDFDRFFADYEPDPERRRDYINAIIWELGRNPRGLTYGPEDRKTRAYDSNHLPAWPVLRIWLWFETEDRIHFCDVDVA